MQSEFSWESVGEKIWKSVYIRISYDQKSKELFLLEHIVVLYIFVATGFLRYTVICHIHALAIFTSVFR